MTILEAYFADHLSESAPAGGAATAVTRVGSSETRLVLFKVGELRFALASTAIAAYTRAPEAACHYVAGAAVAPARYRAVAATDSAHVHYIHLAGTRFGIGPCKADGETLVHAHALVPRIRDHDDPWIIATLSDPPSLVLDSQALCARLHALVSS